MPLLRLGNTSSLSLDIYSHLEQESGATLSNPACNNMVVEEVTREFNRAKDTPIIMHGRRVESMFLYVAMSLGKCVALKLEDAGLVAASRTRIKAPDYRLVLDGGEQILVEVKNHYPKRPEAPLRLEAGYLAQLARYGRLFNCQVKVATYWGRWRIWTLSDVGRLLLNRRRDELKLLESLEMNEMHLLGDLLLATVPPLTFALYPDKTKPVRATESTVDFTIGNTNLFANDTRLTDRIERNLAWYLMFFGDWPVNGPEPVMEGGELGSVVFTCAPKADESSTEQPFRFIGSISAMISRRFDLMTASDAGIERLWPNCAPDKLGPVLPTEPAGLPLWQFVMQPRS